jgi:vacuolar iron transporter family protein
MGVAGAPLQQTTILLTGLAGLLAGAISMALGEWLSVQSSREVYARQIAIEKEELETAPAEELEELALIYQAKGIPADRARELASSIIANPRTALDTLAREELGIDPQGLGGSAWVAAGTSLGLFASGALGSFFTGQPVLRSGVRQASFGMAAAGITFALGKLVGTGLGL